jgi:hypothetical protein
MTAARFPSCPQCGDRAALPVPVGRWPAADRPGAPAHPRRVLGRAAVRSEDGR